MSLPENYHLTEIFQEEYDKHFNKYLRGCSGCIVAAWAIQELANRIPNVTIIPKVDPRRPARPIVPEKPTTPS